ncbi:patatin-like phospholipase family protein [Dyadobacter sp. CY323]|uniref:patatin-like phospholipase family protein n=1 Tax=Dyadobacter sp. CY323 TaxID=2907302 RepID=UPI001F2EF5FA|nr:patatin-like phospholipase family protein [Dyadobacter sp. CY323]MCE6992115.1 patatin-like phospholipase family protein [Dyadobacter sp. CY323]
MFNDLLKADDNDVETVIICSGGGALGLWQWTVLMELAKRFKISMICGCSAGSLNAFAFAKGLYMETTNLYNQVFQSNAKEIFSEGILRLKNGNLDVNWFKAIPTALFKSKSIKGLMGNGPLLETLKELNKMKPGFAYGVDFGFNATDMKTGKVIDFWPEDFEDDDNLMKGVTASATIPVLLPLVHGVKSKKGTFDHLGDGGVAEGTPMAMMFRRMKPGRKYRVISINCNTKDMVEADQLDNIFQIAQRTMAIMMNQVYQGDLDVTMLKNEILKDNPGKDGMIFAPVHIIECSDPHGSLNFTQQSYISMIDSARRDVQKFCAEYSQAV